jgi:hypothetical protein
VCVGALAGSIGVRETVLAGAGLSALACLVVFAPGVRDPERADYAPVPLPGEAPADHPARPVLPYTS